MARPGEISVMDVYKIILILFISGKIEFLESIKDLKRNDAPVS